jgi:S1-C subfamily serine protease
MLRVVDVTDLVAADLGSSDALRVGEDVVAIGNALGLGGKPTVTTGIVSAVNRTISDGSSTLANLIQTDAAINPGNSGGPLLNSQGDVVGINTAKIPDASNIGFALAIDNLLPLIEDLRDGNGEVTADTPFLGVSTLALAGADVPPELLDQFGITEQAGLIVSQVTPGSGADEAGLTEGDVIREVDGEVTDANEDLGEVIRSKAIGDAITVAFERMGERQEVEVTLGRRGG